MSDDKKLFVALIPGTLDDSRFSEIEMRGAGIFVVLVPSGSKKTAEYIAKSIENRLGFDDVSVRELIE